MQTVQDTIIARDKYKGMPLVCTMRGVARRWHVQSEHGTVDRLGFRSKAALKRHLDREMAAEVD